jgi:hypothetical protein
VQSYDVFPKDVSVAYGNNASMIKMEASINQLIMGSIKLRPMEMVSVWLRFFW